MQSLDALVLVHLVVHVGHLKSRADVLQVAREIVAGRARRLRLDLHLVRVVVQRTHNAARRVAREFGLFARHGARRQVRVARQVVVATLEVEQVGVRIVIVGRAGRRRRRTALRRCLGLGFRLGRLVAVFV